MSSKVAYTKLEQNTKEAVLSAVARAMELAEWRKHVKGKKIFLKVNLLFHKVVPGACTSPWVLEGVINVLKELGAQLFVGDANVATIKQVEKAAKNWGILDVCSKFNIPFVNLSKQKTHPVKIGGKVFDYVQVPEILLDVDCIVTIPVVKTHTIPHMTCALKNQWGCIPRFRHQYHRVADIAIAEVNKALNVCFAVADATVCLEGNGPVTGMPKVTNSIFASGDLVALDTVVAGFMGLDYSKVGYILNAEKLGLGTTQYELVGEKLVPEPFVPAQMGTQPIVRVEMALRKIPLLRQLIFHTPLFKIPAWIASRYNSIWWYHTKGKKYAQAVMDEHPLYREEFLHLIKQAK